MAAGAVVADSAYINGRIYTVDAGKPWAQAVAIANGRFAAVGSDEEISAVIGPDTRVTDLQGRMAMPAISDLHIHPLEGTLMQLYGCNFQPTLTLDEIARRLGECVATSTAGSWIRGGVFGPQLITSKPGLHRAFLDRIAPENPVVLRSSGGHTAWANTAALKLAGIGRDTPDPENGFIVRDKNDGEPTGLLNETAMTLVLSAVPEYTAEQYAAAISHFSRDLNRQGVTTIKDAATTLRELEAYADADGKGMLTLRVATSLLWPTNSDSLEEQTRLLNSRSSYRTTHVNPDFIKIFVDGSAGARKARYLEPYRSEDPDATAYYGEFLVQPDELKHYLVQLDKLGLSVKMHCGGDAAVRAALDAIEAARKANGESGIPHEISHVNIVSPSDIPRFTELNAIPDLSPVFWYPHPVLKVLERNLGPERVSRMWRIHDFLVSGAVAAYGSDWPAITPNTNPWRAMEAMITRRDPDDDNATETFAPEQAIDLASAIELFTRNGAYAMRQPELAGSVEVGKYADMIVLQNNLFDIPPEKIGDTRVLITLLDGEVIYRD